MEYRRTISITSRLIYMSALASFCMSVLFYSVGFAAPKDPSNCELAKTNVEYACDKPKELEAPSSKIMNNGFNDPDNFAEINQMTGICFNALKSCADFCSPKGVTYFKTSNINSFIRSLLEKPTVTVNSHVKKCLDTAKNKMAFYNVQSDNKNLGACKTFKKLPNKDIQQEVTFKNNCQKLEKLRYMDIKEEQFSRSTFSSAGVQDDSTQRAACDAKSNADPNAQWRWSAGGCHIFKCERGYDLSADRKKCNASLIPPVSPGKGRGENIRKCKESTEYWDEISEKCIQCLPGDTSCKKTPQPPIPQPKFKGCPSGQIEFPKNSRKCVTAPCDNPTLTPTKIICPSEEKECKARDQKKWKWNGRICEKIDPSLAKKKACRTDSSKTWDDDSKTCKDKVAVEDPKKKECLDRIAIGEELEWNGESCVKSKGQANNPQPDNPDSPGDKEALTKGDVENLKTAMDNAASNIGGGGGGLNSGGGGGLNVGNTSVGGNNSDFGSSSYDGSNSDNGDSRNSSGRGLIGSPQKVTALPRGPQPFLGYKKKESGGNAEQGNPGGLGGNPGLGGGGRGRGVKPQKVKGAGRRGKSRLWEAAKQLVSGSFFGGGGAESGGGNSPFQKTSKQKRFLSDGQGRYIDTKGMTQSELNSLNDSFRNNIPGYKPAPATSGLLGHEYNQLVTTILKNETMLNRYGCEPPLTTCEAVKRMTASTKKSRRKPSSVKSKRKRKKKRSRKRRKKRRK